MLNRLRKIASGATLIELALGLASILLVLLIAWWFLTEPGRARRDAAQARGESYVAGQRAAAASQATEVVSRAAEQEAASADLTQRNNDEIRRAPGAAASVDRGVHDAGLRALCLRDAFRTDQRCVALRSAYP